MKDDRKFRIFIIIAVILVAAILSYNSTQEFFTSEVGGYLKRKLYFEEVISKKGLPMHPAKYWKELKK
ncbi:MAG: hypothetical protein HY809_04055 [Nitrospirae bacterium]|nr:hypothetical protein [Nitrospirota bacterium]